MSNANTFFESSEVPEFDNIATDVNQLRKAEVLSENTVLFRVEIGGFGNSKGITSGEVMEDGEGEDSVDKDMVNASKKLMDKKYIDAIGKCDTRFKKTFYGLGNRPSFLARGMVIIKVDAIRKAQAVLELYKGERQELVNQLLDNYEEAKADARRRLKKLYDENDYPSRDKLRDMFKVYSTMMAISFPEVLEQVDIEMYNEYRQQHEKEMEAALEECRQGLRVGLNSLIKNLLGKVSGIGTERKQFKDGFVNNVKDFLNFFDAKDVTNDAELREQVERIRNLLDGVSPDDLRNDFSVRVRIENELSKVSRSLDSMLVNQVREVEIV
jgi:hypothetical protein